MITEAIDKNKYFFCYDIQKAKYIRSNGVEFVTKAYHFRSNEVFYLFERTPRLQELMEEYDYKQLKVKFDK